MNVWYPTCIYPIQLHLAQSVQTKPHKLRLTVPDFPNVFNPNSVWLVLINSSRQANTIRCTIAAEIVHWAMLLFLSGRH